jgi:hypothetical protein
MALPNQPLKLRTPEQPQQSRTQDNFAALLTPIATALSATPIMGAAPPAWIQFEPLLSGMTALGQGWRNPSFHKDALSYTHVTFAMSTAGIVAFTSNLILLPVGYRPSQRIQFPVFVNNGGVSGINAVYVSPDGNVQNFAALAAGDTIFATFSFLAEQ